MWLPRLTPNKPTQTCWHDSRGVLLEFLCFFVSHRLPCTQTRVYERGTSDLPIDPGYLTNSSNVTVRAPPEILGIVSSYLTEEDLFSASQVCRHWREALISFPSLWTQFSCRNVPRTIVSLERCKAMPIQLVLDLRSSTAAVENVLNHGNKIASLTAHDDVDRTLLMCRLLTSSRPSVKRLSIYSKKPNGWRVKKQTVREIWKEFPSLQELFVYRCTIPIDQLTAPNLIYLALEHTVYGQDVTVQSILDMLHGCPVLETLLIANSCTHQNRTRDHSSVSLPRLRIIELGSGEVHSGLETYLQFSQRVAGGFRMLTTDARGDVPPATISAIQHMLRRIEVYYITL